MVFHESAIGLMVVGWAPWVLIVLGASIVWPKMLKFLDTKVGGIMLKMVLGVVALVIGIIQIMG